MSYKPLPNNLTIKESLIHGLGVFVTEDVKIDTSFKKWSHISIEESYFIKDVMRVDFGGFINHSREPNCTLEIGLIIPRKDVKIIYYKVKTIKDILEGEEITLDYNKEMCGLTNYKFEEWL